MAETDTFFDLHQRATIAAAMARVIPTDHEPGAREAGAIEFLERYLSGNGFVYALPDGSGFEQLDGQRAEAWRQRIELARSKYLAGVMELDRRGREMHGSVFVDLDESQQDDVLSAMDGARTDRIADDGPAIAYGGPVEPALQQTKAEADLDFFPLLVTHTRQGFYADPIYGGNRNQVGWKVIGFPGPSSLAEVHTGRYSTLDYFADDRKHPGQEDDSDA